MSDERIDHEPWPMRAFLLLGLGALSGLAVHFLTRGDHSYPWSFTENVGRLSLAIMVASGGILFAFTLERLRWTWSLAFAVAGGAVLGGIYYWNGSPEHHSADDFWRALASLLAIAIAAPLFQTMRDEGARRLPYVSVHAHSWTNVVLWFAAWAFVLISWLLLMLLGQLFELIGVHLLQRLLEKAWFDWMLVGGTLGAGVGLLRDRDKVVGLLQRVVTTVLSMLAPVLAIGLVLFVLALPFAGFEKFWDQTQATTPILLACTIGAIILANAVIGNSADEEAKNPVLRISAMALGAVMTPLVAIAALSTGLRIGQHGYTPARLWAVVFVGIATVYSLFYLYALVRGRMAWAERARPANIRLAIIICIVALLLATPLAQFGAISTRSQLARLNSGAVPPAEFDWRAMRFDFGASGVRALERLKASGAPEVRRLAQTALAARFPYDLMDVDQTMRARTVRRNIRVMPGGGPVPPELAEILGPSTCAGEEHCILFYQPGAASAVLVTPDYCREEMIPVTGGCEPRVSQYYQVGDRWQSDRPPPATADAGAIKSHYDRLMAAVAAGRAEIRTVPSRQVFVDGEPVGNSF